MTTPPRFHGVELTDEIVEQIAEDTLAELDALTPEIVLRRAPEWETDAPDAG